MKIKIHHWKKKAALAETQHITTKYFTAKSGAGTQPLHAALITQLQHCQKCLEDAWEAARGWNYYYYKKTPFRVQSMIVQLQRRRWHCNITHQSHALHFLHQV